MGLEGLFSGASFAAYVGAEEGKENWDMAMPAQGINVTYGTEVPKWAFWSTAEVNTLLATSIPASISLKLAASGANYAEVLTPEERESVDAAIVATGNQQLAQTSTYHIFGDGPALTLHDHYADYEKYDWGNALTLYPNTNKLLAYNSLPTRSLWTPGGATPDGPGGSGENYMQADFRSSPFQLPDIDIQRFRIEPVLRAGFLPARRPGRFGGIREHPSRYNTMRVMGIGGDAVFASTNFILTGLREESSENFSVNSSMWGLSIRFDIEKYSIYTLTLELINAQNFDWLRQFKYAWKNYLRGSVLAGNQWRFYILSGARLLGGYPVKYQMLSSAKDEPSIRMSMVMIITDDEALPRMQKIVDKRSGLTFFRWEGSVYSSPIGRVKESVIEPVEESQDLIASDEDETTFPPEMTVL